MGKKTWQYEREAGRNACSTCNATGTTRRRCPTFADYKRHDRSGCRCDGGTFYDRCTRCKGAGYLT